MTTMTRARRRGLWAAATVVLLLALALAACGGRGLRGGDTNTGSGNNAQQTSDPSQGGATLSGSAAQVASTDGDLQQITAALDSAQTDASVDLSGTDNEVQP